jgi:hypothetical protein
MAGEDRRAAIRKVDMKIGRRIVDFLDASQSQRVQTSVRQTIWVHWLFPERCDDV